MQSLPAFHVGGTIYFEFQTKKPSDGVTPISPDSTPTVTVYKNGSATMESATVTSLSGVTGGYSVSLNPASDAETDNYILKVEAAITDADFNSGNPFTHPEWFHTRCIGPVTAIQAKTDNLPSDPADQSLIIAATDAVIVRLGNPAGASVSADIAAVKVDTGNLVTRITSTLFTGITSLADWVRRISRKDAGTDGMTTAQTEINTGGTATFAGTTDSLEAIRDASGAGDASQATLLQVKEKTDLIGTAQGNTSLIAAAVLAPGTITGFPSELVIGDSYDVDTGAIEISILDSEGDPITSIGSLDLADADIEFTAYRTGDPEAKWITGVCTYASSVVSLLLPSSETSKGIAEFTYEGRLKFIWVTEDAQKTFKTTQFKFVENP
jgi:hypothetical protein